MRIVSLCPSITEILVALKSEDQLVGVSEACEIGEKRIERLGSPKAIQFSKLDLLAPEWILADTQDHRPEDVQRLQKKWKTKLFEVRSIQDVRDTVAELGKLLERREEARGLNQEIQKEAALNQERFPENSRKRTVLLLWNQPAMTVNFDTYASRLLEACGGVNVFRQEPVREFFVEPEDMIEKNPEVLLLSGSPGGPFQSRHKALFRQLRVFSKIPIHLVEGKLFTRYGLQTIEALRRLREIYTEAMSPCEKV